MNTYPFVIIIDDITVGFHLSKKFDYIICEHSALQTECEKVLIAFVCEEFEKRMEGEPYKSVKVYLDNEMQSLPELCTMKVLVDGKFIDIEITEAIIEACYNQITENNL
jgi:hypothetical protein